MVTLVRVDEFTKSQQQDNSDGEWIPLLADTRSTDDVTGKAIAQCERYFIKPYKVWLVCVGWGDYKESPSKLARMLRWIWAAIFFGISRLG